MGAAVWLATACTNSEPEPASEVALSDRAAAGLAVDFVAAADRVTFRSSVRGQPFDYSLGASGTTTVVLDAADNLVLSQFDLDIDDLMVSTTALPPDGLVLTDIRGQLADPIMAPATLSADELRLTSTLQADLLLDFSAQQMDGSVLPLTQRRIPSAALDVALELKPDGAVDLEISVNVPGEFFTFTDMLILNELVIVMEGSQPQ